MAFTKNFVLLAVLLAVVSAEKHKFSASLSGGQQVPPVDSPYSGKAEFSYDTELKALSGSVSHNIPSEEVVMAHIHQAPKGENGDVVFTLEPVAGGFALAETPITEEQHTALHDGLYYVNIHTTINENGELRGQLAENGTGGTDTNTILILAGVGAGIVLLAGIIGFVVYKSKKGNVPDRAGKGGYKAQQDFA